MREPRRIFKGRQFGPRFGGSGLGVACAVVAALFLGFGLPSNLFGSAPADRPVTAEPLQIRVFDGETLGLGDRIIRLSGIAAPSRGEACGGDTSSADCGAAAAAALARLVHGQAITCRVEGYDGFRRGLGRCIAGGRDVNAAMVESGFALASASVLRPLEVAARNGRQGLWADASQIPAEWRRR
ncbi:MAG: thermonuclease family protein [Roseomonas sp.]|nr:thermonuclease family protein [Roseomonas sp.]MCA3326621.1 thermonuclease family protein [Roseomonas sp.]MCA3329483.1 thermonuclease family protein [Roseomonas sp.]MCA3335767.1 thermonuclease family protein [Roseomonas sp.]MCA3345256.1 thermonuclease family protein [Roseomonas sp.]